MQRRIVLAAQPLAWGPTLAFGWGKGERGISHGDLERTASNDPRQRQCHKLSGGLPEAMPSLDALSQCHALSNANLALTAKSCLNTALSRCHSDWQCPPSPPDERHAPITA